MGAPKEPGAQPVRDAPPPTVPEGAKAGGQSTPSVSQAGERRVVRIESLRALAALGVIWAHVFGATGGEVLGGFDDRLMAGVGFGGLFFYALSGCLLYMPFARRDFGDGSPVLLGNYAFNRVVRVFPLYYFALVAVFIVYSKGASLDQFWRFALFLQNYSTETAGKVNGVLWTAAVEVHFFLLLPLIAYLLALASRRSARRALLVLGGVALASIAFQVVAVLIPHRRFPDPVAFSFPANFYFFAIGMAVPLVRESWRRHGRPAWVRGLLASRDAWLLAAVPFWLVFAWSYDLEPVFTIGCFLVLGACLLPLDRGKVIRILDWRPLGVLGLVSFSVYIWHIPVARFVVKRDVPLIDPLMNFLEGATGSPFIAFLFILVPLSWAVAFVSYVLIESPPLRLRRRWGGLPEQSVDRPEAAAAPGDGSPAPQAAATPPPASR